MFISILRLNGVCASCIPYTCKLLLGSPAPQISSTRASADAASRFSVLSQTAVTKQLTAKWPYISNAVFPILQNHGEKSCFRRCWWGVDRTNRPPLDPPLHTRVCNE